MARLKGAVVGFPSGKCGDIVYRIRYGQPFMYKACKEFHKSESDESKKIRERMTAMSEFGSIVKSIPELSTIWKKSKVKAKAAYHKIQKFNAKMFDRRRPTTENRIVPDFGFKCPINEIEFDRDGIYIKTELGNIEEIYNSITTFIAINVICVYEPINSEAKYFELFAVRKDVGLCLQGEPIEISFEFEEELKQLVTGYKKGIAYFELVALGESGNPLAYSDKYSNEFELGVKQKQEVEG